jgi:hypothetical protein
LNKGGIFPKLNCGSHYKNIDEKSTFSFIYLTTSSELQANQDEVQTHVHELVKVLPLNSRESFVSTKVVEMHEVHSLTKVFKDIGK